MRALGIGTVAVCAVLSSACGSSSSTQSAAAPKDVLFAAAHLTTGTTLRVALTADETFTITGDASPDIAALSGQSLTFNVSIDAQSRQRSRSTITTDSGGQRPAVIAVLYDGSVFISKDSGVTFQSVPLNGATSSQYGADNALQYLDNVSAVSDTGPATVDGVPVEQYHAQLDSAKMTALLKSMLSSVPSKAFQTVLSTVRYTGGYLDASVDHAGHLVHETGSFNASLDFGALDASQRGVTMTVHAGLDARFYDYGAAITVQRPTGVSGTSSLGTAS